LFGGTVVGLIGVLATADWQNFWTQKNGTLLIWLGLLLLIAAVSGAGFVFYWIQMSRKGTPHSRLRQSLDEFFETNPSVAESDRSDAESIQKTFDAHDAEKA